MLRRPTELARLLGHIDGHQLLTRFYSASPGKLVLQPTQTRCGSTTKMVWRGLPRNPTLGECMLCAAQRFCNQRKVVWSMEAKTHILIPPEVQPTDGTLVASYAVKLRCSNDGIVAEK